MPPRNIPSCSFSSTHPRGPSGPRPSRRKFGFDASRSRALFFTGIDGPEDIYCKEPDGSWLLGEAALVASKEINLHFWCSRRDVVRLRDALSQ